MISPALLALSLLAQLPEGHPPMGTAAAPNPSTTIQQPAAPLPADHPPASGRRAPTAAELIEQLDKTPGLRDGDKAFEVAYPLGKLYYSQARYADAAAFFAQAICKVEPAQALLQPHAKVKAKPVPPAECSEPSTSTDRLLELARANVKAKDLPAAVACLRPAVALLQEARVLRANALYLTGKTAEALGELGKAIELEPPSAEALFARGAILVEQSPDDVATLKKAKQDFDRALKQKPDPIRKARAEQWAAKLDRAIAAGGYSKLTPMPALAKAQPGAAAAPAGGTAPVAAAPSGSAPPQLDTATMQAFQNTERTPEMEARFDQLLTEGEKFLAARDFEKARANYRQVMPFRPSDGRTRAGLAWALIGAGAPMGDNIFKVAAEGDPAAVDRLGDTLKALGDAEGAKQVWTKLAATAPGYADKLQAKLK
jgi:tetratricopeptide (TPR) repeat protein